MPDIWWSNPIYIRTVIYRTQTPVLLLQSQFFRVKSPLLLVKPHIFCLVKSWFCGLKPWTTWQMGMDQYLLIPFLVGWTSIYQLFWCSPGVPGFWPIPKSWYFGLHFPAFFEKPPFGWIRSNFRHGACVAPSHDPSKPPWQGPLFYEVREGWGSTKQEIYGNFIGIWDEHGWTYLQKWDHMR